VAVIAVAVACKTKWASNDWVSKRKRFGEERDRQRYSWKERAWMWCVGKRFFKVLSSEHRTYPKNVSRKAATGSVLEIKLKSIINRARKW